MTIKIRDVNPVKDIHSLASLTTQLGYPTSADEMKQRLNILHQYPNYHTWVVELDAEVLAYTGFVEYFTLEYSV